MFKHLLTSLNLFPMHNPTQPNQRTARFMLASASLAMLRIAQTLEAMASRESDEAKAERLIIMASDLAHHSDAIAEASGWSADTEANLKAITAKL